VQQQIQSTDVDSVCGVFTVRVTAQAYARLHISQREQGVTGHVAEVGVYQGRGFIPLCLLCGAQVSMTIIAVSPSISTLQSAP
jgi:hypothetical protein